LLTLSEINVLSPTVAQLEFSLALLPAFADLIGCEEEMGMISVADHYTALLHDYSEKTGVSVERCVSDALFDWLANVAPVILEQLGLEPLKVYQAE
jgi:hypothetical protein